MALTEKELYLKMGRPLNTCIKCEVSINVAGKHPSILRAEEEKRKKADKKTEDDAPLREDYCPKCWHDIQDVNYSGFWLSKREPPKPRKIQNKKERNAALMAYFDNARSSDEQTPTVKETLFFTAHLLMKYGVFKWNRTETDEITGIETIIFRHGNGEDDILVEEISLTDERGLELKNEVDEFLSKYSVPTGADKKKKDIANID